ncbi:hypothetical protein F6Q07_09615 [Pectobacterium parmentieri]|uniref:hypothetical protein n=2 Tax=Pectobacterium parmentieri TaxID=1905730 RepID=UPI0013C42E19|nr:hypothetical protein [Pectobacterium parmentieri]MBI0518389.1 hypothetical protein [Pectobacterium parmentieri]
MRIMSRGSAEQKLRVRTMPAAEWTWFLEDSAQEIQPVATPNAFSLQSAFLYSSSCDGFNTEKTIREETI